MPPSNLVAKSTSETNPSTPSITQVQIPVKTKLCVFRSFVVRLQRRRFLSRRLRRVVLRKRRVKGSHLPLPSSSPKLPELSAVTVGLDSGRSSVSVSVQESSFYSRSHSLRKYWTWVSQFCELCVDCSSSCVVFNCSWSVGNFRCLFPVLRDDQDLQEDEGLPRGATWRHRQEGLQRNGKPHTLYVYLKIHI